MTYILFNPLAHNKAGEEEAKKWVASHGEKQEDMVDITTIKDPKAFADRLKPEDKIILIGGDGTLTRFADAVREIDIVCPVYYTSSGTGNDFLRDVPEAKTDDPVQINKYIKNLPRVYVNGEEHVFINGIGYGLDGYCCEVGDAMQKESTKPVNYTSIAIKGLLGGFKPCDADVTVDGVTEHYKKVWLAPTMNGRCYGGGLFITPNQDRLNEDGHVSVAVVHGSGRLRTLLVFPSISNGTHLNHTNIISVKEGHEVTVKFSQPCALQIDGETILNVTEYSVRSRKSLYGK